MAKPHEIDQRVTPISYMVTCTCGWRFETTRRQNAWAREQKIRAAVRRHLTAEGWAAGDTPEPVDPKPS